MVYRGRIGIAILGLFPLMATAQDEALVRLQAEIRKLK
jgi:hypothetical protein